MVGPSAAAAVFGGVLRPGITGINERCTLRVSDLNPEVNLHSPFVWDDLSWVSAIFKTLVGVDYLVGWMIFGFL